ncbi:uncharacterized protein [Leptinotarsa decemlineata]|uniref:uncharacterized protein n=1 Tax=Leptinotarsa decemlineata TaxID=7539 RepID=UPI003D303FD1
MYCGIQFSWNNMERHESSCRLNKILCPSIYDKALLMSDIPARTHGEYHERCQIRKITCPFNFCGDSYQVTSILDHWVKFHKEYIFTNEVQAKKILKEEKIWNFIADTQVCLVVVNQIVMLLFVHSNCESEDSTGDITCYNYYFGVFSLCLEPCGICYVVSLTCHSDNEDSTLKMKNQEIKPFNDNLHRLHFLKIGLCDLKSFDFMTTKFVKIKRLKDMRLSYSVKICQSFEPLAEGFPKQSFPINLEILGKSFECPICKDYMCPPVYNCQTGHTICKNCKMKMRNCPFCQAAIGKSRNFVLEEILETLSIPCQNEAKGCGFVGRIEEVKFHEVLCPYK